MIVPFRPPKLNRQMIGARSSLKRKIRFIFEKQSESYSQYGECASQKKIGFSAKKPLMHQACIDVSMAGEEVA